MDTAKAVADRREQWRFWKYLDEQVQQAAERYIPRDVSVVASPATRSPQPVEDPASEWSRIKRHLAQRIHPIAYSNWIEHTRQIGRTGATLRVWVTDEATRDWIENEYAEHVLHALAEVGCARVEYTTQHGTE